MPNEIVNKSGIYPKGPRILVRPTETLRESAGGIIIPMTTAEREDLASMFGHVVAMGPTCYLTEPEPRCAVGDYIIFAKYAGTIFKGDDGVSYRLINSTDVVATKDFKEGNAVLNDPSRKEINPVVIEDTKETSYA